MAGTEQRGTIESLIADLNNDDIIKCQHARRALVAMGRDAIEPLEKALSSKKQWVRWEAAKALGQIGDVSATEALVHALKDKNFDVRWLAAMGLITIGKTSLIPLLHALTEHPDSVWLRQGAHHVLHDMDRQDLDEIVQPVMKALEDVEPSVEVPWAAKKALESLKKL